ncbi:2-isopropylmalate synthase [Streptomyces sp. NBC_00083]|uniref:2-isopropylmalate synthase n=1 Tax=Streptomyces sp. NBC_00083 TaxID=2975647 RepID=UPI0022546793|nr:2-isopropylmalate synthase [Streptomyces sp. NBC_00083]MCX5384880.1 2-isopropylmalate synthase [Streptomyces sp. NBC_00083]
MVVDVVRESAGAGRIVLWEESARDGAQAKTLMTPGFRVELAREMGRMFGADGPRHVVFAAGFPAVCGEEFEAVRRVAAEAEGAVSVAAVCRGARRDLEQAVASVRGSRHARVMVVVPASEAMAQVMVHRTAREALQAGVDLVKHARDLDDGVAVDICLADASRADHALMAHYAQAMTDAGAGVIVLADTVGAQLPFACGEMFRRVRAGCGAGGGAEAGLVAGGGAGAGRAAGGDAEVGLAGGGDAEVGFAAGGEGPAGRAGGGTGRGTPAGRAAGGIEVVLASHLHNDLGLGLANTLEALAAGVRVVSSSWLGIAERAGMVATEQLLFLLARHGDELLGGGGVQPGVGGAPTRDGRGPATGPEAGLWWTEPDLTRLPGIARRVAEETGVPLTVTTPIVGAGVGSISTGTPFVHPTLFQPFDPEEVLGIEPRVVLTHLASARVVTAVAGRLGHTLDAGQNRAAMAWVKERAYRTGRAVVEDTAFADYLAGLKASINRTDPNSSTGGLR